MLVFVCWDKIVLSSIVKASFEHNLNVLFIISLLGNYMDFDNKTVQG